MLTIVLVVAAMAVIVVAALAIVGVVAFPYRGRRVPDTVPAADELNGLLVKLKDSPVLSSATPPRRRD